MSGSESEPESELDDPTRERVDDLVYRITREEPIPGLSVAVVDTAVDDRGPTYAVAAGSRNLDTDRPATPDTLYGVASCTKSVAAFAVTRLADEGLLSPTDPVTDHVDVPVDDDVTVHGLLSHSSGYPSLGVSETLLARQLGLTETGVPLGDRDDHRRHLADAGTERVPPGERYMYCNTGYYLVDRLVETLDGRSFAAYATEEILAPLGMDRSTFDVDAVRADEDRLTPYRVVDDTPEATSLPDRDLGSAPGGLFAPVSELADYLRLHLAGGVSPVDGDRLVSEAGLRRTHTAHVDTPQGGYGYGWAVGDVDGHRLVGHSGSILVSGAYLGFLPDAGVGVAVGANTSPEFPLRALGTGVLAALVDEDPDTLPVFARRDRFDRYVGTYDTYNGTRTARVERDGEFLRLDFVDDLGGATPLVPVDGTAPDGRFYSFTPEGDRDPVQFVETNDGVDCFYDRWRLHKR